MSRAFDGFGELSREEQFARLVLPRGDWAELELVETALLQILPRFKQFGYELPQAEKLLTICRDGRMREYVTIDAKAARDGGLMTIYPQHGGLKELGKRQSIESSRWKLATLVMICVDEWRQRLSTAHSDLSSREDFAKRMDSVWRSVRLISPAALEYLPDLQQSPRRIHRQLESVVQKIDSSPNFS